MAIGIVSRPLRDNMLVAPNSPSDTAAARPAATTTGRRRRGRTTVVHARSGEAPSVAAASRRPGRCSAGPAPPCAPPTGGDERLADRHQPPRGAPIEGRGVERDHHAEADGHGRVATGASAPCRAPTIRVAAATATAASVPTTSARTMATMIASIDARSASRGSTPSLIPGRSSIDPRLCQAPNGSGRADAALHHQADQRKRNDDVVSTVATATTALAAAPDGRPLADGRPTGGCVGGAATPWPRRGRRRRRAALPRGWPPRRGPRAGWPDATPPPRSSCGVAAEEANDAEEVNVNTKTIPAAAAIAGRSPVRRPRGTCGGRCAERCGGGFWSRGNVARRPRPYARPLPG